MFGRRGRDGCLARQGWGGCLGGEVGADVWGQGRGGYLARGRGGGGGRHKGNEDRGLGWILDFALLALILRGREYGDTDCYG